MTNSTIRILMDIRHTAHERNEAVEDASRTRKETDQEWAFASRIWSRQAEALLLAVIAETPTSVDDALSVLICLAELRDQRSLDDDATPLRQRDLAEMTDVAIHNCTKALAGNVVPEHDRPETEHRDLIWGAGQVVRWLPTAPQLAKSPEPHMSWLTEYEAVRLKIDDSATKEGTSEYETLCARMNELERIVMATPAHTREAVVAKMFMSVRVAADGESLSEPIALAIVDEARRTAIVSQAGEAACG